MRAKPGEIARFLEEVAIPFRGNKCLFFTFIRRQRYPYTVWKGKREKLHRIVCEVVHGPPPSPNQNLVAHRCGRGVEGCINPRHLRWATRAQNEADKILLGEMPHGSKHWQ